VLAHLAYSPQKMSVNFYHATHHHSPEDGTPDSHCEENSNPAKLTLLGHDFLL
jgi:hypothetical protein